MNKIFVLIFFVFAFCPSVSASVVKGKNKEYAGKKIVFYKFSDPVTLNEDAVFTIEFDKEGNFYSEVKIPKTIFVSAKFGIYRGMLFLEPEKTIELIFPPLKEKSFADEKNPYFEPVGFWFTIKNDQGVNQKITSFEAKYNQLTDKYFNLLYFRQSKNVFDTVLTVLNHDFPDSDNEILSIHKNLKLKLLETDVFRLKPEEVSESISKIKSEQWEFPSFIEFFGKIFANRLSFDSKETYGTEIKKAVATVNTNYLLNHVKTKYKLPNEVGCLVLLKMLHDGFYSGEFSSDAILKNLESDIFKKTASNEIRIITLNVLKKLKTLLPGSEAPVICLKDISGNKHCSNENSDKFKYIVFADNEMVVCQEHLKYLSRIQELFSKNLEIVLVMRKTDIIEMKMFLEKNNIPGLKLVDESGDYIKKYKIRSFPTCLLLDEKHKVVLNNAKAPLDGFEQQYAAFIQKEMFERQRNQKR